MSKTLRPRRFGKTLDMKRLLILFALLSLTAAAWGQRITIDASDRPAEEVFRQIMAQTGKNFVYQPEILDGLKVNVTAVNQPLKVVLQRMFDGTGITFRIKGNEVLLKRERVSGKPVGDRSLPIPVSAEAKAPQMLEEVVVVSRLEAPEVETAEIGARKITATEIARMPALLGEVDVIKALQLQPGVSAATEGMAGMNVHGGASDENLYMLDNVPLYQVNHFAGLFSAFNVDAVRYIDFFKTSVPAKYDGRLSSFLDVRTKNGNPDGHHGSAKLGLTSGAFNINGPIGGRTSYLVALRRSWYDVLTIPVFAVVNSKTAEKVSFNYAFMDLNAKVSHQFSDRTSGYVSAYFGDDYIRTLDKENSQSVNHYFYEERNKFHWGNVVGQMGLLHKMNDHHSAEFTLAFTRFFSSLNTYECESEQYDSVLDRTIAKSKTSNNINDFIARADFSWTPNEPMRVRYGANITFHRFQPQLASRESDVNGLITSYRDSTWRYLGGELNAYIEDDWRLSDRLHLNAGVHASGFRIEGKNKWGISPRLSVNFRVNGNVALKGSYTRTTQYVHQLSQSYLSLPTDQWIPVTGRFKPQTADKIAAGVYWQSSGRTFTASVEGYWKWMRNLLDYCDQYYLKPIAEMWDARLTSGHGTAKGIDFKVEKILGKVTGQLSYSLGWVNHTFAGKNGGKPFPARYDHRHSLKISANWVINSKVELSAAWIGHSGNRFTLLPQQWQGPDFNSIYGNDSPSLKAPVNNYQLPFYHRLDLGVKVRNNHGYWNFGLYNAYCHMNAVAIRRSNKVEVIQTPTGVEYKVYPVFQKVSLIPVIPSISYTWEF